MMASTRQAAVSSIASDALLDVREDTSGMGGQTLSDSYGRYVFGDEAQQQRLPANVYMALRETIEQGKTLSADIADEIANAMKEWAVEHGATHYTHWFQPMTGLTAEKHDSFLRPTEGGSAMLKFSGRQLSQGEPDASSFPSGGLRATFEARGYTAWDPSSPAFLRKSASGATLCIPSIFCSWTGDALDKKTPLLRSCQAISKAAVRMLHAVGENAVDRVSPTTGIEQEYFLVDRQFYHLRPDLMATGRTLFGCAPYKGQEFDDHYFGSISGRVLDFMRDLEKELWLLGVPVMTRHNEVAPSQFELAPQYSGVSVSVDQNMLTMSVLKEVASRHGLAALMHEKPYAGFNGSGKHMNWSIGDNLGNNLLEPGKTPHENLKFMLVLTAIIRAVDLHQDLLRVAIASAGNDHRLGANEAPPAIISIFVGDQLSEVIDAMIEGRNPNSQDFESLRLGVDALPQLPKDISDRNRTSPFAFTGNKFEFRAVSSNQSVAYPAAYLNTIVAESMDYITDQIDARGGSNAETIQEVVRETLAKHRRILFDGDNYSAEWVEEAARRELLNRRTTPEALAAMDSEKNAKLFETYGVLTRDEFESRRYVKSEIYVSKIRVEARAMVDMAATIILPAAIAAQRQLAETTQAVRDIDPHMPVDPQVQALRLTCELTSRLQGHVSELRAAMEAVEAMEDCDEPIEHAKAMLDQVIPAMERLREVADLLEKEVDDDLWPLPKYRELMFIQ
ncbi:MAG: glutamine synthetase [Planctomycetota bacterium]|jgi:glutamine synthetase